MTNVDFDALRLDLRRLREEASSRNQPATEGIARLRKLLADVNGEEERFQLYLMLELELQLNGDYFAALDVTTARWNEFRDIASQCGLGEALMNCKRHNEGMAKFKSAFQKAVEEKKLVNMSFEYLARGSLQTRDIETLKIAAGQLLQLPIDYTENDIPMESDWLDDAQELGLANDIINAIIRRARAQKSMLD
ncbi:hypothetical protein PY365_03995 [Roseiarcaceae bacterium H3SJ34-1]|uniref:hypothetical protein n=1 Tax=Terripilifer ovatus TaxID=3032367 RepID=UPI003AB9339B|nr:hypothetical protein [Roseiarcaceae bacterium H3SJ34-1]